jgi:hypothetical protein
MDYKPRRPRREAAANLTVLRAVHAPDGRGRADRQGLSPPGHRVPSCPKLPLGATTGLCLVPEFMSAKNIVALLSISFIFCNNCLSVD